MKIEVYHVIPYIPCLTAPQVINPANLTKVATVDCVTLEHAFTKTNHVTQNWSKNDNIVLAPGITGMSVRSTSVGDVMHDTAADKWHVVDTMGMKEIPNPFATATAAA